jgi:enoyl-CoA hydratase
VRIRTERRGRVEIITMDRPEKANAFDPEMMDGFGAAFRAAEADDGVWVVILTGAGDRAFSSGLDITAFARGWRRGDAEVGIDVLTRRIYTKPVVAAVNGAAVAGGFELMLACDLVVAAAHACFGMLEVKRGLLAAGGATALPARLPLAIALEMGLTGDTIDAERALAIGLVNRVVPSGTEVDEAVALAERVCDNGPLAVRATKRLMWETARVPDFDRIQEVNGEIVASADAAEGARAFGEHRAPKWTGR